MPSSATLAVLPRLAPQELGNIAWAFATELYADGPVLRAIAGEAKQRLEADNFEAQGLSNLSWAFARLEYNDATLLGSMAEAAQARIAEFSPQALANMLWAFASLEFSHEPVMSQFLGEVQRRLSEFQFQGLVGIAWSFAQLVVSTPPLLDAVAVAAIEAMHQAQPKEVLVLAQAFERLGHDSFSQPELWARISEDIEKHFLQMEQELQTTSSELPDSELVMGSLQVLHDAGCLTEKSFSLGRAICSRMAERKDKSVPSRQVLTSGPSLPPGQEPSIIAESDTICFLWKPPGWTMSVGKDRLSGEEERKGKGPQGEAKMLQSWLRRCFSASPIVHDAEAQHGLLHRLDENTSGLVAFTKTFSAYYAGQVAFLLRRVQKRYVCVCHGHYPPGKCEPIDAPLKIVRDERVGKRSVTGVGGRPSRTLVKSVAHFRGPQGRPLSLLEVEILTGRLHQIRAHLSGEGFPLLGDATYGADPDLDRWCSRIFLHAAFLGLVVEGNLISGFCPLPADLSGMLKLMRPLGARSRAMQEGWLCESSATDLKLAQGDRKSVV